MLLSCRLYKFFPILRFACNSRLLKNRLNFKNISLFSGKKQLRCRKLPTSSCFGNHGSESVLHINILWDWCVYPDHHHSICVVESVEKCVLIQLLHTFDQVKMITCFKFLLVYGRFLSLN